MAKANVLGARTIDYLELIGNGRRYHVPPYQRDYSWTEELWEELWNDIVDLRAAADDRHYLGSLVVEARSDREFLIIDGQQRLATLSILALAVIARLRGIASCGVEPDANRERAQELRNRFIGEKDPASLTESSRLYLNETDNGFYQDYLVQLREPLNPRRLPRSTALLWGCFRYFSGRIADLQEIGQDGQAVARLLSETVARQLLFILITVDDELNAYTVFETLNSRRLELTTTDLLKNYLFSLVRVRADLDALQRRWRALIATVEQEQFPAFLRYHLLCRLPRVRSSRLFKLIRDRTATAEAAFQLLDELERRAELFAAISDPHHAYWLELGDARQHVRELALFRVRQATPLLFTVWESFSPADFVRVLRLVSAVSFRHTVVSGLNPNTLERVYHGAAKAVGERTARTPAAVFDHLRAIYVDDVKTRQDFSRLAVSTRGRSKKLAKYILARLEQDAAGRACDPDTDPGSIEHILPENPSDEWRDAFDPDRWEETAYRLGNLTLLERTANRTIGNAAYADKAVAYARSRYALSRQIPEDAPEQWTPALLDARQNRMAARAAHLWRSDFP